MAMIFRALACCMSVRSLSSSSNTLYPNTIPTPTHLHQHIYTNTFVTTSQKTPQNKLQKKHFAKKCKNKLCRDALPPKTLLQKPMKQATVHTTMHAQTTHTSQCNDMHLPRSHHPYIFPTTPTTICTIPPYSTAHRILPITHITIHNHHQPWHLVSIQRTTTLTSLSTIITYLTKHNTLHYNQLKPSQEHYSHQNALRSTIHHSQAQLSRAIPHNTTLPPTHTTNTTHINYLTTHSTKFLHFTKHTHTVLPYKEPAYTSISQHAHKTS